MDAVNQWIAWASQGNNWIAFLVVGLIGLFLGWLFTRIPAARARGELEARSVGPRAITRADGVAQLCGGFLWTGVGPPNQGR